MPRFNLEDVMDEKDISEFWQINPCGEGLIDKLSTRDVEAYTEFFDRYDRFRYTTEGHVLQCLDKVNWQDQRVLEIGLGQGADSEQLIRRGALWSGLDLTPESVDRVKMRLQLRQLSYDEIKQGSALEIPFADNSFDIVFSHGVLHHIPQIDQAQREIARVLKRDGQLIAMFYAKWSLNYLLAIGAIRRLGLIALVASGYDPGGIYSQHIENARKIGLWRYLRMGTFIHHNTDGAANPYSKVYDVPLVCKDFPSFKVNHAYKRFMHAPPLPVKWMPLAGFGGWHLWVHLSPANTGSDSG